VFACINISLCVLAIIGHGIITVYTVIGICFFMSVMFPTIFALSINGLQDDTELGSSLIIMSIVGGAVLPRAFGYISDVTGNIQYGYVVPAISFVVVAYFGYKGHKVTKNVSVEIPVSTIY
jgi:FHS family L-fucose permease-like MFS transporter